MADSQSNGQFQPENSNFEFEPESGRGGWRAVGGENFSWNKAAIGVGAVAAVAGAAYAASRYMGRSIEEELENSDY